MAREIVLVAHDIRSAHNVGAFFRTADGAGVAKIYLTGYTMTPSTKKYLLTQAEKQIKKTALGAEKSMPWEKREDVLALIQELKHKGFYCCMLEQDQRSIPYNSEELQQHRKIALLVGNEVEGVSDDVLREGDAILEIPMRGTKNSLNVSVATGIALYALQDNTR